MRDRNIITWILAIIESWSDWEQYSTNEMLSTYKRHNRLLRFCIDLRSYQSDEFRRKLRQTSIAYVLLLFQTIVQVIWMKLFYNTNCIILAVTTYDDEPAVILRWISWNVRSISTIPSLFGSFIVGWTTSTKRNGGGPWMKYDGSATTCPLQSHPSL